MVISMIAAHDPDLVIGRNGELPWHIPEDLAHFKKRTKGHAVIMGRAVFEELDEKPLPDRRNIVLSRRKTYDQVEVCQSKEEVLKLLKDEEKVYIIGGEQIYKLFYPVCTRLEMTVIHESHEGDTFFPEYRNDIGKLWKEVFRHDREELSFVDYERILPE